MGVNWLNNHRPHPPPLHRRLLARPHQSHHCQRMISPVLSSQTNYYNIVLVYAAALGCGCGGSVFVFYWFSVNKICISLVRPVASVAHRVPGAVVSYNTNNNRDTGRCHTGTSPPHHPYQLSTKNWFYDQWWRNVRHSADMSLPSPRPGQVCHHFGLLTNIQSQRWAQADYLHQGCVLINLLSVRRAELYWNWFGDRPSQTILSQPQLGINVFSLI